MSTGLSRLDKGRKAQMAMLPLIPPYFVLHTPGWASGAVAIACAGYGAWLMPREDDPTPWAPPPLPARSGGGGQGSAGSTTVRIVNPPPTD